MQLLLIVPFMRFGELMLHAQKLDVKPAALFDIIFHDPGQTLLAVGHALLGWVVAVIPAAILLSILLQPVFVEVKRRYAATALMQSMDGHAS